MKPLATPAEREAGRERPILFSAWMVRAILAGQKTQTRRAVKLRGPDVIEEFGEDGSPWPYCVTWAHGDDGEPWYACPYGQPGDRLWVRERFSPRATNGGEARIGAASFAVLVDGTQVYRDSDGSDRVFPPLDQYAQGAFDHIRWRPSIHMPRWASRLTLEVTSVRVERLHDISEEDAIAEGVAAKACADCAPTATDCPECLSARAAFSVLWSSINGAESWDANPWVWVIAFRRVIAAPATTFLRRDGTEVPIDQAVP